MKRLVLVLLAVLLLCGCGRNLADYTLNTVPTTLATEETKDSTDETREFREYATYPVERPSDRVIGNAFYYPDSRYVYYYDVDLRRRVVLCSQPNCTHSDDGCTAYLGGGERNCYQVVGDTIYALVQNDVTVQLIAKNLVTGQRRLIWDLTPEKDETHIQYAWMSLDGNSAFVTYEQYDSLFEDIDKNPSLELFRKKVVCSRCGSRMVRVIDDRKKNPVIWRCESYTCNTRVAVLDGVLEKRIVARMNLIIDNLDLLDDADDNDIHGMEVEQRSKVTDELSRMCDSGHYSDEQLLTIILENAQKRYALCPNNLGSLVGAERDAYSNAESSEHINIELFQRTVSNILLNSDGSVQLQLMSGKTI